MKYDLKIFFNEPILESKRARGDNILWQKFKEYYNKKQYIYNSVTFIDDFSNVFKELTGKELIKDQLYYIKELDVGYGLSSGEIYTNYWIETVIPYVQNNFK